MSSRKGRPATRPANLKDGFYIEAKNSKSSSGIKIHRDTEKEMLMIAEEYSKTKVVTVLGEYKNGKPVNEVKKSRKRK